MGSVFGRSKKKLVTQIIEPTIIVSSSLNPTNVDPITSPDKSLLHASEVEADQTKNVEKMEELEHRDEIAEIQAESKNEKGTSEIEIPKEIKSDINDVTKHENDDANVNIGDAAITEDAIKDQSGDDNEQFINEPEAVEDLDLKEKIEKDLPRSSEEIMDENILPVLRLTPITAKSIPKNYSSTSNTVWHWGTNSDDLTWDVNFPNTGNVDISVDFHDIQSDKPFVFAISINDDNLECFCNTNSNYPTFPHESCTDETITRIAAGNIDVSEPGAKTITARVTQMSGDYVGNLYLLDLKGTCVESAVILSRNANTVSVVWDLKECEFFYSGIEIVDSCPGTFFGVCCFTVLELGLYDCQGHRSVWFRIKQSPDNEHEQCFEILEVDEDVKVTDKKEDETKSLEGVFQFAWNFDTVYHVLVKMQEVDNAFQYTFYFYKSFEETWKRVIVFKMDTNFTESEFIFRSLIEDRRMGEIKALRRAKFGPCWFRKENDWHQVDTAVSQLVNHTLNTNLELEDDRICLFISPNPTDKREIDSTMKVNIVNSVPRVLESVSELSA